MKFLEIQIICNKQYLMFLYDGGSAYSNIQPTINLLNVNFCLIEKLIYSGDVGVCWRIGKWKHSFEFRSSENMTFLIMTRDLKHLDLRTSAVQ
jgi:hypothetical protein